MPALAAHPPVSEEPTAYDIAHLKLYMRLVDAAVAGAPWQDAARIVLGADVDADPGAAEAQHRAHLARARWMVETGYLRLAGAARDDS